MDALKSAGRAIIKSPGVPRHTWGTSKHEKLPENWTDTKETLLEGMVFQVKYLGMTLVGQPKGEDMAAAAIHRIVSTARASAKKFRKVTLTISPKGIIITDTETLDLIENVSIYRAEGEKTNTHRTPVSVTLGFIRPENLVFHFLRVL
uniref:PID domain-containing protein n=1 Tax=Oncorhynchus tshawytscha TaxID=74940 RepID=A0A8C8FUU6_ONCTS